MSEIQQAIDGLIRSGEVKPAIRDQGHIDQFLKNAAGMLGDARVENLSVHGRFILAYEGLHCLAMAFFNNLRVRHDGQGHRQQALQFFVKQVGLNDHFPFVSRMHEIRNLLTYEKPAPPVSAKDVRSLIDVLAQALGAIRKIIPEPAPEDTPPVMYTATKDLNGTQVHWNETRFSVRLADGRALEGEGQVQDRTTSGMAIRSSNGKKLIFAVTPHGTIVPGEALTEADLPWVSALPRS